MGLVVGTLGQRRRGRDLLALWYGFLVAPVAWSLHLLGGLIIVSAACGAGYRSFSVGSMPGWQVVLLLFTVVAFLIAMSGAGVAYRTWRQAGRDSDTDADPPRGRDAFMGLAGLYLSGLFSGAIVMVAISLFWIDHC